MPTQLPLGVFWEMGLILIPVLLVKPGQQGQCRFELLLCAREGDRQSSRAAVGFLRGGAAGLTF